VPVIYFHLANAPAFVPDLPGRFLPDFGRRQRRPFFLSQRIVQRSSVMLLKPRPSVTASEAAAGGWIPSLKHRAVAATSWRRRPVLLPGSWYVLSKQNTSGRGCAVEIAARCLRSCKSLQARRAREEQDECDQDRVGKPWAMHSVPLNVQIDVPEARPAEPAHCHALPAGRHPVRFDR
jgi:hypothetical protein